MPSISTVSNAADNAALPPSMVGAGTVGELWVRTEKKADDAALLKSVI